MESNNSYRNPKDDELGAGPSYAIDDVTELESHFILRLPLDAAQNIKQWLQEGNDVFEGKLQINFNSDMRHAQVKVDKEIFNATLMDLPCIIETLKTVDRKNFYKVADCPQILICKREGEEEDIFKAKKTKVKQNVENKADSDQSDPRKRDKQYQYPHGITPPLKNVRKRRFRKTLKKKYMDAPELEKELKRLLRTDLEAVSVRWELVTPEQEAQQRSKTSDLGLIQIVDDSRSENTQEKDLTSSTIKERELFGDALSSTSSEDEEEKESTLEGRDLARQLMSAGTDDETSKLSVSRFDETSLAASTVDGEKSATSFPPFDLLQ